MAGERASAGGDGVSAGALSAALSGLAVMPAAVRGEAARAVAARLVQAYGGEAVNVVLKCQDAFMQRGEEEAAASMIAVLDAVWAIEDRAGRSSAA